jgi:hypothetical protein
MSLSYDACRRSTAHVRTKTEERNAPTSKLIGDHHGTTHDTTAILSPRSASSWATPAAVMRSSRGPSIAPSPTCCSPRPMTATPRELGQHRERRVWRVWRGRPVPVVLSDNPRSRVARWTPASSSSHSASSLPKGDAQSAARHGVFQRKREPYLLVIELGSAMDSYACELGRYTGLSPRTYARGFASPASPNAATISSHCSTNLRHRRMRSR